ncbi:MAG: hypothetical protein LQ340_004684 [Diploschistes diacapsis]|nr:MAG: hypothetical protein LQ340_004684 [Diploschistes diacapsis]
MRNLRNLQHKVLHRTSSSAPSSCAWDASSDSIICAIGPSENSNLIELRRWAETPLTEGFEPSTSTHIASWDAPSPNPSLPCDHILDIHYFPDNHQVCVVLAGGDIVLVTPANDNTLPHSAEIEIVGSVDVGVAAAAWSPDEELLAILTNADTFLYMTRTFENVVSVGLAHEDLQASKHVSVGWGKAETQFRGKGAKAQALRDPTVPERIYEGAFSIKDGMESTISWRGDGAYVAVNSPLASSRRVIRVYSREGELDGVSEPVDFMESALTWRPAGNLLASVQRLEERVDIIFFERNGLRHGQFSLRLSEEEMETSAAKINLQWNFDSSTLAVCFLDRVQLWTMANYHYYLKQEIRLPDSGSRQRLPSFAWHPEQPLLFAMGLEESIQRLQYDYRVASGSRVPPYDYGLVSVIDGSILKITPLRISIVPPPMSLAELSVKCNIVDACYFEADPQGSHSVLLAVLDQEAVSIYQWNLKEKASSNLFSTARCKLSLPEDSTFEHTVQILPRQVTFVDRETIVVLASDGKSSLLTSFNLAEGELKFSTQVSSMHITELVPVSTESIASPCCWIGPRLTPIADIIIKKGNEEMIPADRPFGLSKSLNVLERAVNVQLAAPNKLETGGKELSSEAIAFGLDRNGTLFADGRLLSRGCTSFLVTNTHLIFTTSQHLLKFVHLTLPEQLEVPEDTPELDERCRSIERGARLVTVIPSTSALVLQMPRGNLETIYPRALVLPLIRKSIDENRYKKAFLACRNHRVDMNILHDHAPGKFLYSVDVFIDQVQKLEHIDLFLSQLREEDVSETMYKNTVPDQTTNTGIPEAQRSPEYNKMPKISKVNSICDAFLRSLSSRTSTNLQNVITAHVCKNPPDLEASLLEVASMRQKSLEDGEKVVEHICFLADVNRLFDAALGLYDLELTLQIAQQSQRDPREYVPFLQKLKDQAPLRRQVDIDNFLGRFDKALTHLQELDDFEAFKAHMVKHSLYEEAIALYRYQEPRVRDIMKAYADYLRRQSRHKDAGIAYEYLHNYADASESYRLAHLWQEALSCASLAGFDEARLRDFASAIAESQIEQKDYRSAAVVSVEYLKNIEEAIRLFCRGYWVADAMRLIGVNQRPELLQSIVDAGLAEGQAAMTELLAECRSQLNAQVPRIRELRIKKVQEPLAFYDAEASGGADIPDNISLAGTDASTAGGTLFTRYTNQTGTIGTSATRRTSKKRRQEERKRARGKKGSVYEEEYLVNSIARLIERVNSIGDEVERLVMGLMRRGMRERALAVESAMVTVVTLCKEHTPEVFQIQEKVQAPEEMHNMPEYRPNGGDAVLLDSMQETRTPKEPPIIKDFRRLSLLGT